MDDRDFFRAFPNFSQRFLISLIIKTETSCAVPSLVEPSRAWVNLAEPWGTELSDEDVTEPSYSEVDVMYSGPVSDSDMAC